MENGDKLREVSILCPLWQWSIFQAGPYWKPFPYIMNPSQPLLLLCLHDSRHICVTLREQTDSTESRGAVGVTTSWESPLQTHDLVRQNAKTRLVDNSVSGESHSYHMGSAPHSETDNRSRLLATLCLDDRLDLDPYAQPRWASMTEGCGGQAVASR